MWRNRSPGVATAVCCGAADLGERVQPRRPRSAEDPVVRVAADADDAGERRLHVAEADRPGQARHVREHLAHDALPAGVDRQDQEDGRSRQRRGDGLGLGHDAIIPQPDPSRHVNGPSTVTGAVGRRVRAVALHLHRAPRTDQLADALGELLAAPLDDPFAEEFVVVPAKGVERWLTQRLSHRLGTGPRGGDGVCAGVRFLNPRSLVSLLLGRDRDDAWDPDRLVWPLLATIDDSLGDPQFATARRAPRARARRTGRRAPAQSPLLGRHPAGQPVRVVRRGAAVARHRLARRRRR